MKQNFKAKFTKVIVIRCSNCYKEINQEYSEKRYTKTKKNVIYFCDKWCKEEKYPPRIVKCFGCGVAVLPTKKNGFSGHFYNKYCELPCCKPLKTRWKPKVIHS